MVARATEEENRRSNGQPTVQLVTRSSFEDKKRGVRGVYTEKYIHTRNFLPAFIKAFLPEQKCILIEKVGCSAVVNNENVCLREKAAFVQARN